MKRFRLWLASKILGHEITDIEVARQEWIAEHLKQGDTITLSYVVEEKPLVH